MTTGPIFGAPIFNVPVVVGTIELQATCSITNGLQVGISSVCRGFKCYFNSKCSRWSYRRAMNGPGGAFVAAITACGLNQSCDIRGE
jgi:hypothetical protein